MSGSIANNGTYGNPGAPNSPWGPGANWNQPGWDAWRCWHAAKPLWVAAMVLGFIFWWPVGLILLFCGIWGKRMAYWGCGGGYGGAGSATMAGGTRRAVRRRGPTGRVSGVAVTARQHRAATTPSTNTARRLCAAWRMRRRNSPRSWTASRFAKDKAEFDQFMKTNAAAARRHRPLESSQTQS